MRAAVFYAGLETGAPSGASISLVSHDGFNDRQPSEHRFPGRHDESAHAKRILPQVENTPPGTGSGSARARSGYTKTPSGGTPPPSGRVKSRWERAPPPSGRAKNRSGRAKNRSGGASPRPGPPETRLGFAGPGPGFARSGYSTPRRGKTATQSTRAYFLLSYSSCNLREARGCFRRFFPPRRHWRPTP